MYAQLVETGVKRVKTLEEMSPEERNFQEKIDAEIKICLLYTSPSPRDS